MNKIFRALLHSQRVPRVIDRRTHAVLDYLTTGYFLCLAGYFWGRHPRASATAMVNAIMVLETAMFTDYPGALKRVIPFETHGKIDVVQAVLAAGMPALLGFGRDPEAAPFQLQAVNEMGVVSATDWESPLEEHLERRLERAV